MSEYVITINSTSDLPKEWVWEREIPVVPLNCTTDCLTIKKNVIIKLPNTVS